MLRKLASAVPKFRRAQGAESRRLSARMVAVLATAMVAVPLVMVAGENASISATPTSSFGAAADAFVDSGNPGTNYGTRAVLKTDATSPTVRSYLRFNVANLAAPVTKATLQVYAKDSNSAGFKVAVLNRPTSNQSKDGLVVEQQPRAGASIPGGVQVTIFIGRFTG